MKENNLEKGTKGESKKFLKEIFLDSFMFPPFAILTRVGAMSSLFDIPLKNIYAGVYLGISSAFDLGEMLYRVYGHDELNNGPPMKNSTCSCFERHLFYDLPKYLYKKIKKK